MKKGTALPFEMIVVVAILLVAAIVAIAIFTTTTSEQQQVLVSNMEKLKDCDCDNIANFLDKCPCIAAQSGGEDGCPAGMKESKDYSCFQNGKCRISCYGAT